MRNYSVDSEYSHVKSKVASAINGEYFPKKEKSFVKLKTKSSKSTNLRQRVCRSRKPVKPANLPLETDFQAYPMNIRTEVAVKLFADTPKRKNSIRSSSVAGKSRSKSKLSKRQQAWITHNCKPVMKELSDYEKFEKVFIQNRTERMAIPGHSPKARAGKEHGPQEGRARFVFSQPFEPLNNWV